jgi:hypothetical protein
MRQAFGMANLPRLFEVLRIDSVEELDCERGQSDLYTGNEEDLKNEMRNVTSICRTKEYFKLRG